MNDRITEKKGVYKMSNNTNVTKFKEIMGNYPTGVTVVTTVDQKTGHHMD